MRLHNRSMRNKFLNNLFIKGQKHNCEKNILKFFKSIQKYNNLKSSKEIFKLSIINSSPFFKIKTINNKRRKKKLEIPFMLDEKLRLYYGIKNIINNVNLLKNVALYQRLQNEFIQSANLKSKTIKKNKLLHEDAFLKRKFARYRWF